MPFLFDEAFDTNDHLWQLRALARNFPQKNKSTPTSPTDFGVTIDNVASGAAVGDGRLYLAAVTAPAAQGTIVLTAIVAGGDVVQAGVGTARTGLTTISLNATGPYIEDANGGSSRNWVTDGFAAGSYVKVNGALASTSSLKWNGYYRISSISSNGGGTNNRMNLNATDVVGSPGNFTNVAGLTITPIGTGAAFTVSGTAGVSGLCVAGQRFVRNGYSVIVRTLTNWSITTNADRLTATMGDGAFTRKYLKTPTVNFTAAGALCVRTTGDWDADGFRAGGGIRITSAVDAGNNNVFAITLVDTATNPNDRLTLDGTIADETGDAIVALPLNSTVDLSVVVNFTAASRTIRRTDSLSWVDVGYQAGDYIRVRNAVDSSNNGFHIITSITTGTTENDTITVSAASSIADETADTITANCFFVPERWGDRRFSVANDNVENTLRTNPTVTGEEPPLEENHGHFNAAWQMDGSGLVYGKNLRDFIYLGIQTEFDDATGKFNWHLRGQDGFVSSSNHSSQPNASFAEYLTHTQNASRFLACCNGEHLRTWCNPTGATYTAMYLGWLELHAARGQHPAPIFVGGSSGAAAEVASSSVSSHSAFWDPGDGDSGLNNLTSACFRRVDGVWSRIQNKDTSSESYNFSKAAYTSLTNAVARVENTGDTDLQSLMAVISRALGNVYEVLPIDVGMTSPTVDYYGRFHGVFQLSGEAQTVQNTFTLNGVEYIVINNVFRTGKRHWAAFAME